MLIKGFERGRCLLARLDHGTDIISQITDLAMGEKIETGFLSAIGALSKAELGYYDHVSKRYGKILIEGPVELVYCSGNISMRNDQPFVHAHAALSDKEGRVWGGHLNSGTVFAAELYMQELLGQHLERVPDQVTGLNLWSEE